MSRHQTSSWPFAINSGRISLHGISQSYPVHFPVIFIHHSRAGRRRGQVNAGIHELCVRYVHGQVTHPIGCETLYDFCLFGFAQSLLFRPVSATVVRGGLSPAAITTETKLYRFACLEKPCATSDGLVDGGKDFLLLEFRDLQPPKISEVFFCKTRRAAASANAFSLRFSSACSFAVSCS